MKPEVGMPVTYQVGSDRYVGTIVAVNTNGKAFHFRREGRELTQRAFLRDGKWIYKFGRKAHQAWSVTIGVVDPYRDPSF